jgi:hypothetical protein
MTQIFCLTLEYPCWKLYGPLLRVGGYGWKSEMERFGGECEMEEEEIGAKYATHRHVPVSDCFAC